MLITVVNHATQVTNQEVYDMTILVDYQIRHHVAPAWGMLPAVVAFHSDRTGLSSPAGTAVIGIFDNADQAGDLGWHTEAAGGIVFGRVFAAPVLQNGGDVMLAPLSVCSVLSHEVIETFLDASCDLWADAGNGTAYAREGCDAVESDSYHLTVGAFPAAVGGAVSDFLLPAWFDPDAPVGARFDYLGLVAGPLQVRSTGYTLTMTEGAVSQAFGEHYPEWRKETKQYSVARTARRLRQGGSPRGVNIVP